jgi:transcriptional regulator with XRE-family HTH domain
VSESESIGDPNDLALRREIGARVRARRKSRGISMVHLAAEAEISQPFLSKLERGETTPSLHTLYRLAIALGTNPAELMPSPAAAKVTVVRSDEGTWVTAVDDPSSPLGRLILPGEGGHLEVFDYAVDASHNVGDWFESPGEAALILLTGELRVEVRGQGEWDLRARDVLFMRGDLTTRWTSSGPEQASILLVTVR